MKNAYYLVLLTLSFTVQAEVFKCKLASGKIVYQSGACAKNTVQAGKVKVQKLSPEEAAAAKAKMEAWQQQQAAEDALQKDADKAQQAELQQQESLDLQRRSVAAQEKQASSTQRNQNQGGGLYDRRFGNYPYNNGYYPNNFGNYNPGYQYNPYDNHGHGGQYYQYPDQPKRRPGEYPYPTTPTKPAPIKIPEDQR